MIPYGRQEITSEDVAAVASALGDPFLTQGPRVEEFEAALCAAVGSRFAVVFNSGTAALHAAYFAAGVGPGASVLTSPITFVATANAALYLGAEVRFADVDATTGLLDADAIGAERAGDVRVLAPVHFGGQVGPAERYAAIAAARGWLVVEDAAHALGATYRTADGATHRVGSCAHSAMCCFSFHPVKHITTGEGGAVTTNDPELARSLRRFRTHGITRDPSELTTDEGPWYYEQHALGFNYRLTDLQCALGLSQLARLEDFVERRRRVAARYDEAFARIRGVTPLREPAGSRGSYHLYVVRVTAAARRRIFEGLRAAGIGVNVHYIPVYRQPYYRARGFADYSLPGAEEYYSGCISIPMYPGLTDSEVARVVESVAEQVAAVAVA